MKKKFFLFLAGVSLCTISHYTQAQIPLAPINIQSPNVATLGEYGNIPVSYFTGVPNIQIPIYTIKNKEASVAVALSYHAAGFRPDMHPGWVGNGWNLSAGGVISRTVKDVPDDYSNGNYYLGANMGFYFNHNVLATSNWNQIPYMQSIAENDAMLADTEPDEFSFNFGDYSGAFFLDHNGNWQVKSNKALKVTYNGNFLDNPFTPPYGTRMQMYGSSKTFGGFTITTDDGTQYVFGGVTDAIEYGIGIFNQDMSEWVANSWYLTKIIDVNGNETDFTYQRDDYISQMYISVVNDVGTRVTNSGGFLQPSCSSWSYSSIGASYGGQLISPVYLQQISTPNAVVKLNRSTSTELRYSQAVYDWSYYMWSMNGGGVYGVDFLPILSNYGMNYYPQCLDLLQWKKLDEIRIEKPDGTLLKSINFNYNNNANERLTLLSITEQGSNGVSKPPFTFYYDTSKPLPGYLANMTDHWGFYNGTYADISNQSNYYNTYFGYRQPNADFLLAGTLTSIVYPTGGITSFVFEPNDYSQQVNLDRSLYPQTFSSNQLCGGLRVKKITSYDVQSPQQKIVKEYYYVQNYNSSVNASGLLSSGVLGGRIKYYFDDYRVRAFNDNGVVYSKSLFSSQSVLPGCVNAQGSHIGYSQVVEKMADNSYKIFHYSNYDTGNTDEGADNNLQVSRTEYEPYSSNEESRGKLLLEEDFDSNNHIVSSHQVQYVAFNKQTSFIRAMKARYFNVCPGGATSAEEGTAYKLYYYSYLPVSETNTIFDQLGNAVNSARSYTYNNLKLMYTQTATNSLGKQEITTYNYPADIAPIAGSSSPYAGMVAKNM